MSAVVLQDIDGVRIPVGIDSLESFRQWAKSDDFPERGRFAYLGGEIWVDLSKEQAFSHNQVKAEYAVILDRVAEPDSHGYYFMDGMFLSIPLLDFATVPDGMFVSFEAIRSGRVELVEETSGGYVEVLGPPDMVLEVVSDSSVLKDTEELLDLYWRAGVTEYWLVDARGDEIVFDLYRRGRRGFVTTRRQADGWLRSAVFAKSFRLTHQPDALGNPQFTLEVRPA